jgi:hypothetical protein
MSTVQPAVDAGSTAAADIDPRLGRALQDLTSLLVPGETLEALAVQRRLFALRHRRMIVAATSGRLIAMSRHLFGGFGIYDLRWQDLKDVQLRAGMFGSTLTVHVLGSQDLAVQEAQAGGTVFNGLSKLDAEKVYRICQANGQAWREKRRQRELEEMRARAGGVQIGSTVPDGGAAAGGEPVERLERAKEMLAKGLISDAEYESIKAKILGSL